MPNPNVGAFFPSTQVWDVGEIYEATNDPKLQELFIRLYQNLNRLALTTNVKDSALYVTDEFVNGQSFIPTPGTSSATTQAPAMRQAFRKLVFFGALPNNATKAVAHDLTPTANWSFTRIYGTASDTTDLTYIPLPYSTSVLNDNIELYVDNTNVTIVTHANYSNYDVTYVIIEYLKT